MARRMRRAGAAKPAREKQEAKPTLPVERHSGEGSASALETLQKLESRRRLPSRPSDTGSDDGSER